MEKENNTQDYREQFEEDLNFQTQTSHKSDEEKNEPSEETKQMSREEELEQEVRRLKDDYLRLKADFENYRRRMQDEMQKAREKAISNFVEDLLPNIDNFEMSLKMTNDTPMFIKGVEMIHQNLLSVLQNHSVSVYEPQAGEEFDVKEHEPVLVEHDEHPPGTITGVITKGYKMKDTIIRPARVQVVKSQDSDTTIKEVDEEYVEKENDNNDEN